MLNGQRKPHYAMSLRLKPSMGKLLDSLAMKTSMDKTTVIVMALQDLAERKGVPIPTEEEEVTA